MKVFWWGNDSILHNQVNQLCDVNEPLSFILLICYKMCIHYEFVVVNYMNPFYYYVTMKESIAWTTIMKAWLFWRTKMKFFHIPFCLLALLYQTLIFILCIYLPNFYSLIVAAHFSFSPLEALFFSVSHRWKIIFTGKNVVFLYHNCSNISLWKCIFIYTCILYKFIKNSTIRL